MMGIGERILRIRIKTGLSQKDFAEVLGVHARSVQRWEIRDAYPGGEILKEMCVKFHANINWLLTGEGEPYAKESEPDIVEEFTPYKRGGLLEVNSVRERKVEYVSQPAKESPGFKISEALAMAARVLESGTSFSGVLYVNIEHFHRAIQVQGRIDALEESQRRLEEKIAAIERERTKQSWRTLEDKKRSGQEKEKKV